jgi:hypothetical protein
MWRNKEDGNDPFRNAWPTKVALRPRFETPHGRSAMTI